MKTITPIQNLELITSVDLAYKSVNESPVYHFVYASQLYGTLFAVYANFSGSNNGSSFAVNTITLRLLNYKGVINIGFTGDVHVQNNTIDFGVIGASTNEELVVNLPTPMLVAQGGQSPLTFNRILHPLAGFNAFQSNPVGALQNAPPTTTLFDSEFYERDGVDFFKSEVREGMLGHHAPATGKKLSVVGTRCRQGHVSLRF